MIIGDFNAVLDPKIDRKDPSITYQKPRTQKLLTDYMLENAMVDPWRSTYPQKQEFSWENTRGSPSRIDFSLIPAHLYHQVVQTEYYTPSIQTDHKVFEMHMKLDKFRTGRGYPKVKNSLYCDPEFVSKVSQMISETTLAKLNENPENTLDLILFNTQTIAQQHSQELKKQQSQALEYLNLEIKTVEAQLDAMTTQTSPHPIPTEVQKQASK